MLPKRFARFGLHHSSDEDDVDCVQETGSPPGADSGNGTFDFLGLTHYWTKSRQGFWVIKRRTAQKTSASHQASRYGGGVATIVMHRCNTNTRCSAQKLRGHFQYYGIRGNFRLLEEVRHHAEKAWRYWLSRRSSTRSVGWEKFEKLLQTYVLPTPRIVHTI